MVVVVDRVDAGDEGLRKPRSSRSSNCAIQDAGTTGGAGAVPGDINVSCCDVHACWCEREEMEIRRLQATVEW